MNVAIDHWYQLYVKSFNGNLGSSCGSMRGPFDRSSCLAQVDMTLHSPNDGAGQVAFAATVIRSGFTNGVEYEYVDDEWCRIGEAQGIPRLPESITDPATAELGALWTLLWEVRSEERLAVLFATSPDGDLWIEGLTRTRDGCLEMLRAHEERTSANKAFLFDLTLTPEVTAVVDLLSDSESSHPGSRLVDGPVSDDRGTPFRHGQPIMGFRTWLLHVPSTIVDGEIVDAEPRLVGPNYSMYNLGPHEWTDAETIAECLNFAHKAPSEDCGCGIYAHHAFESTEREFRFSHEELGVTVRGAVLGSGDVMVHQEGWRAETARIIAFDAEIDPKYMSALRRIAARFDVPILPRPRLLELAGKKGETLRKSDLEGM